MALHRLQFVAFASLTAGLLLLPAATPLADVAHGKFERIEQGRFPAGTRVTFSAVELNAWAADEALIYAPGGIRNMKMVTTADGATGTAMVDFIKLRQAATHEAPGWIMKNLFAGERPVLVKVRFQARNRRARVDVERVEVSGVPIEGTALDFLIRNWVWPTFPDVKVNQWFDLGFRVDSFSVQPGGATVWIGK